MNATGKEILNMIKNIRKRIKKKENNLNSLRGVIEKSDSIDLSSCDMDDKDVKILAQALKGNKGIIEIDLSFNKIGDKAVRFLQELKLSQVLI